MSFCHLPINYYNDISIMNVKIDTNKLARNKITPDQYVLLALLYDKQFDKIQKLFGRNKAILLRDGLISSKYILNGGTKFKDTLISKSNVGKLLGIRSDKINFWEFYIAYPIKHINRILRAANPDSQLALKHERKYILKVRTKKDHEKAVEAIEAYVARQRLSGKLQYLPAMETVLNNALWEQWEEFIEKIGEEGANWNTTTI